MEALMITFTCGAMLAVAGFIFDALARREARQRHGKSK
jgi:hypothetical protein